MRRLPKFLKRYFWDVDFEKMDIRKYSRYIITRLLNYGDEKALCWLRDNFSKEEQRTVLSKAGDISIRSANFWAIVLGLPKKDVRCLQKSYLKMRRRLWPY